MTTFVTRKKHDTMNERIRKFMETQGLSPSELADTIGVQRSNVSHVLNGRNNPSFPFIEKLLKTYPKLNAKWLLMGDGEMMEGKPIMPASLFDNQPETPKKNTVIQNLDSIKEEEKPVYTVPKANSATENLQKEHVRMAEHTISTQDEKPIEKIIVFYTDQTFKVYQPSK